MQILVLSLLWFALAFEMVGFVLMLIPAIWCFVDLFLLPGIVREYNSSLIDRLEHRGARA